MSNQLVVAVAEANSACSYDGETLSGNKSSRRPKTRSCSGKSGRIRNFDRVTVVIECFLKLLRIQLTKAYRFAEVLLRAIGYEVIAILPELTCDN